VSRNQIVFILDFIGAKDDGDDGDKYASKVLFSVATNPNFNPNP